MDEGSSGGGGELERANGSGDKDISLLEVILLFQDPEQSTSPASLRANEGTVESIPPLVGFGDRGGEFDNELAWDRRGKLEYVGCDSLNFISSWVASGDNTSLWSLTSSILSIFTFT